MANVVDLTIRAKNEASRVVAQVADQLGGLGGVIGRLSIGAGVFGGIAAGVATASVALAAFAKQTADAVEQLDRLSRQSGVSTRDLQVMKQVMRESGGDADELASGLAYLNRRIAEADPLLKQLGITTRDPMEAMLALGRAFRASDDSAKKTLVAVRLLGRGNVDMISDLEAMAVSWDRAKQAMIEAGVVMSDQTLDAARKLDRQLDILGRRWEGAMNRMKAATLPAATAIANALSTVLETMKSFPFPAGLPAGPGHLFGGSRGEEEGVGHGAARAPFSKVGGEKPQKTPRERQLEEIGRLLDVDRAKAETFLAILERVDRSEKAEQLRKKLGIGGPVRGLEGPGDVAERELTPQEIAGAAGFGDDLARSLEHLDRVTVPRVVADWQTALQTMTSATEVAGNVIGGALSGLEAGLTSTFSAITQGANIMKIQVGDIVRSMVDGILAELARIASAKILGFFLSFIHPAAGAVIQGVSAPLESEGVGLPRASLAPSPGTRGAEAATAGPTNITINAIDSRSIQDAFRSGSGQFATYQRRAAVRAGF